MPINPDTVIYTFNGPGDLRPNLIASQTIPFVFAIIAVILRFWSRRISKTKLWWDDWILIPSLATAAVIFAVFWWWMHWGLGEYIGSVTFHKLRVAFLTIWIAQFLYNIQFSMTYFSVALLYWRIFRDRWTRWYCSFLITCRILLTISTTIVVCLECRPLHGFWDRDTKAQCDVNLKKLFLAGALAHIILDVALMGWALYMCMTLQLSRTNKVLVSGVFATGLFVTAISCVRLNVLLKLDISSLNALNITWTFVDVGMWTGVELYTGIVTACLPCLRPIIARAIPRTLVPSALRRRKRYYQYESSSTKVAGSSQPERKSLGLGAQSPIPIPASLMSSKDGEEYYESNSAGPRDAESRGSSRSEGLWIHHTDGSEHGSDGHGNGGERGEEGEERASDSGSSNFQLPLHNMEGKDTRRTRARMTRSPSWPLGTTDLMFPIQVNIPTENSNVVATEQRAGIARRRSDDVRLVGVAKGGPGWI